jgi:hypothetical protein
MILGEIPRIASIAFADPDVSAVRKSATDDVGSPALTSADGT